MKKGILYAIGALVLLIAMAHTAYAISPASCTDWVVVSDANVSGGIYLVPPEVQCLRIDTDSINTLDATGHFTDLVVDLNGHTVVAIAYPSDVDIWIGNGTVYTIVPSDPAMAPPPGLAGSITIEHVQYYDFIHLVIPAQLNDVHMLWPNSRILFCAPATLNDVTLSNPLLMDSPQYSEADVQILDSPTQTVDTTKQMYFVVGSGIDISDIPTDGRYIFVCASGAYTFDIIDAASDRTLYIASSSMPYTIRYTSYAPQSIDPILRIKSFDPLAPPDPLRETYSSLDCSLHLIRQQGGTIHIYGLHGDLNAVLGNISHDDTTKVILHTTEISGQHVISVDTVTSSSGSINLFNHGFSWSGRLKVYAKNFDVNTIAATDVFNWQGPVEIHQLPGGEFKPTELTVRTTTYLYDVRPDHLVYVSCSDSGEVYLEGNTDVSKFVFDGCTVHNDTNAPLPPHAMCETWQTIEVTQYYTTLELNSGCYKVVPGDGAPQYGGYLLVSSADGGTVVLDLNDIRNIDYFSLLIGQNEQPTSGSFEIMNAPDGYIWIYNTGTDSNIYLYNVSGQVYRYCPECGPMGELFLDNSTLFNVNVSELSKAVLNNVESFTSRIIADEVLLDNVKMGTQNTKNSITYIRAGYLEMNNVTFGYYTGIAADTISENNVLFTDGETYVAPVINPPTIPTDPSGVYIYTCGSTTTLSGAVAKYISGCFTEISNSNITYLGIRYDSNWPVSVYDSNVFAIAPGIIVDVIQNTKVDYIGTLALIEGHSNLIADSELNTASIYYKSDSQVVVLAQGSTIYAGRLWSVSTGGIRFAVDDLGSSYIYTKGNFIELNANILRFGSAVWSSQGVFELILLSTAPSEVHFNNTHIDGSINTIEVSNRRAAATIYLNNVTADSTVTIKCPYANTYDTTVVFEGTTRLSDFNVVGCTVVDNTVEPNLTATSDQTYADIAEGDILEYNVTVTSYDAPVDNVVVRATASNYYTQFNQTLEQTIPHIDANQSVTITFEFNLASSPATYKITATVDPDNTIEESDETDNTTQRFYVNVLRYDPACGTLTTGMYKLTQHMTIDASQSEPCYYIPNGETVMFLGGTGITAPTIDFKVFFVEGSLSIHGLWGRGKIHVASSGYAYLDYVSPNTSDGWVVWNEGTTRISRNSEIAILFQAGGTVFVDGPDATIHEYHAYDFTGTTALQLFTDPAGATFAVGTTSAAMYADQPISGDGAYFYLNTAPSVAAQTDSIAALILANGQDGAVSDMNIYYVQVGGKRNDPSELNLTNVNVSGSILIDDQPNGDNNVFSKIRMVNSTANISELGADSGEYYFVNTTVTADNLRFWNNSKVYIDNSSLSIGEFELYSDDSTPVYIFADTTNGPVNIDINSFVGTDPLVIECAPNGHYFLYLSDNIFDYNTTIDPSCYPYIDYQRNLRVDIVATPDSVNPDTNYQITARVYNDAQYTDFTNVVVRLYVDGVPTAEEEVNVPAGDAADVQFTVHSTPEVGTQQIDVVVDPDDIVFEANEQDNIATKEVVVEVQQAPTSNPAPSVGAGGPAAIAATQAIYVSAKVGEEKETAIHVSWKYGFPTKARITYVNINGKIIGPEEVELHTGDNIIPIKVIPSAYGEVGKVIIYAQNEKQEVAVYARPLAQLAIAGIDVKVILILAGIVWLLYLYFRK